MREIKFRAWDRENNKMVYFPNLGVMRDIDTGSEELLLGVIEHLNGYEGISYFLDVSDRVELMQYTGLKDKNGKEIYEGDILNTNTSTDVVIPYYVKEALPFIELVDSKGWVYDNGDLYQGGNVLSHEWDKFEVIGNIYKNPELLKENYDKDNK